MKKVLKSFCLLGLAVLLLAGCQKKQVFKVGIIQLSTHPALNSCTEGFIEALKEAGFITEGEGKNIEITIKNPEADPVLLNQFASQIVEDSDLVFGVATDAAVALKNARDNAGLNIPILFSAVTDPVDAKLVNSITDTSTNVTGSSDASDVDKQIDMIKAVKEDASSLVIIYHTSEINSEIQANQAKARAEAQGMTVEIKTVSDSTQLVPTLTAICAAKPDCVYIPTDNLMASNMVTIAEALNEEKIMTVCGESGMIDNGGTLTFSIDYTELGKMAGKIAANILGTNKNASDFDVVFGKDDKDALVFDINESTIKNITGFTKEEVLAKLKELK